MNNRLFIFILILFSRGIASSQVLAIDAIVTEMDSRIQNAHAQGDPENIIPAIEIQCRITRRTIGTVDTKVTFHFTRQDGQYWSEEEQQEVETFQAIMQKVEITIQTGSYALTINYYFDEIGELVLAQEEMNDPDYGCTSNVYYFTYQKIITLKKAEWKCDKPSKKTYTEVEKITLDDQLYGQNLLKEVGNLEIVLSSHYAFLVGR